MVKGEPITQWTLGSSRKTLSAGSSNRHLNLFNDFPKGVVLYQRGKRP